MSTAEKGPRLDMAGTSEATWATGRLQHLPELPLARYRRAVMVAPHPDDEVLACSGLMQRLSSAGTPLTVVSVTDGEASHPHSPTVTPMAMSDWRARERRQAFDFLGLGNASVVRLGLPDGAVGDDTSNLLECLKRLLGPDVLCVAPWNHDGHPDHDAAGHAAAMACAATGAPFLSSLVWTWHWAAPGDRRVPWSRARRLTLGRLELTRKRWATRSFRSQIAALSECAGDEAILPPETLGHFDRPYEVFLT
ncbi:MAG: PIG-L family deacetylase [Actinomycetota bacterium]|nr:PIG-L family deacetylase [Actinomycetota bacterium]